MAAKPKLLSKSEILSRLQNAQGNPWDEVFKILNVPSSVYEPTEQETEQPAHTQTYKVNFVPRKKDTEMFLSGDFPGTQFSFVTPNQLFYRHVPHMKSLVFAPPHKAARISRIRNAFAAKTWGEFQSRMPEGDILELMETYEQNSGERFIPPQPDDPFNPDEICGAFSDGDYPEWLQQDQDFYLPAEILERWGENKSSVLNGDFWIIDPEQEQEIVDRLRELGILAIRRDDLRFH